MLRMLTAHTTEIDDVDVAVEELLAQLDLPKNGLAGGVAVLTCYQEFLESGVVAALAEKLPYDIIGATAIASGSPGSFGSMQLSLSVITADDVRFSAIYSAPIAGDMAPLEAAYHEAAAKLSGRPALALCILPLLNTFGGEILLRKLDEVSGGVPVYGTVACDDPSDFTTSMTIFGGEASRDRVALVLMEGNINPRFLVSAISEKKIQRQRAVITKSEQSLLMEVNNMRVLDYVKELGLAEGDGIEGMSAIPFIVDHNDGTPAVARAMYQVTPEGYIVCGADMPVGATLAIGGIDMDDVIETSGTAIEKIADMEDVHGVLLFPCLSRLGALGLEMTRELDVVGEGLAGTPYLIAYSGGEVCPLYGSDGAPANQFHNFSIAACIL